MRGNSQGQVASRPASVSVVIPTCARYEALRNTVSDLLRQTQPPLEIIVVDTTPASERQSLPSEVIAVSSAFGNVNRARNEGLKKAKGDFALLLDDDMRLPCDCLAKFLDAHSKGADAVHGSVVEAKEFDFRHGGNRPLWGVIRTRHSSMGRGNTIGVSSGFTSIRMDVIHRIGFLDEAFVLSYDDLDLGYRLWKAGVITVHDPQVRATHLKLPTGGSRNFLTGRNWRLNKQTAKYYFLTKHFTRSAATIELITDFLFTVADRKRRPWSVLGEWRLYFTAYRRSLKYAAHSLRVNGAFSTLDAARSEWSTRAELPR